MVTSSHGRDAVKDATASGPSTPTDRLSPRRRSSAATRQAITGWGFLLPYFSLFILTLVVPMLVAIRNSFFTRSVVGGGLFGGGEMVEQFSGLTNFVAVATNPEFWSGVGRVIGFGAYQIPVMIGVALVFAMLLDSYLVRRVAGFRLAFFLPFAVPGFVAAMIWMYLYNPKLSPFAALLPDGVSLTGPALIMPSIANIGWWTYTGYNMLIFLAALQAIPRDLYEAARLDGASGMKIALHIKLPILWPAALLTILLSIIGTIQMFGEPTIFQSTNPWISQSFTPMMMAYGAQMGLVNPSGPGPAGAISVMMALIAGVLTTAFLLIQRKVVK